ncbi:MAG: potassium transporter [Betaproteobacteria bacterium]|nr:potassium transporter [Betaproteobacteria bacterium]
MLLLEQVVILLLTAVVLVPLFQRFKLGAVLGYLAAGMVIGPWGFGVVGATESTLHLAELGVVLLLFLIGLELDPARLWTLRRTVFGLGGAQVGVTGGVLALAATLFGLGWHAAVVIGLGLALSSTALVMASLAERGQLNTVHGREAFAVLLFQDLAVIPALALLPLLAGGAAHGSAQWLMAAKGFAVISVVIGASRILVRPALKFIAFHSSREVFTAAALLMVVGSALIMEKIGLSMSLGAFLAGVLLADSEFRHELEADIEPFKGLLLGLFFMAVGMGANLELVLNEPVKLISLALALMAIKLGVMYAISRAIGAGNETAQRVSVALAQGGEFAFVLFSTAAAIGIIDAATTDLLVMVVTISLVLAPLMFVAHERLLLRWQERRAEPEYDVIDAPATPVIIAGYGRYGQIVSRVLRMCDIPFTALEVSYQQVDFVRRFGSKIYFGDATRLDLLQAAKIGEAKLFVLAIDNVEASVRCATLVRRHFPQLPILARARNRVHYFRLRDLNIDAIYRETFPSSLEVAHQSLLRLGFGIADAQRAIALFKQHDEAQLKVQHAFQHDEAQLIQTAQEAAAQLKELFEADTVYFPPQAVRAGSA